MNLNQPYAENLPVQCPPGDAIDQPLEAVFRLVTSQPPTARDFASKAALGELCPPEQDDCTWSSCSLHKKIKTLLSYKRLRMERPYIAMLNIPKGVGKHLMGSSKRGHIDFWRYNGVCLTEFVQNAEGLNDDK